MNGRHELITLKKLKLYYKQSVNYKCNYIKLNQT